MDWKTMWMTLFGTLEFGGLNMGFWVSNAAVLLIVVVMDVVFWNMKPHSSLKAAMPNLRLYDLHHAFAVNSLRAGDDIETVQENLGHATASFTLRTNAHATPGMKLESANRTNDFIHNLTGKK